MTRARKNLWGGALLMLLCGSWALPASSHCDTLSGPVVQDARRALDRKDVTPALKWVKKADEKPIREAFARTLAVRDRGAEARDLADLYFFETLVRIHRAGEGAPYTGLKPADATDPGIEMADTALRTGAVDDMVGRIGAQVADAVRRRYARVAEARRHADDSVDAGREFVEAYVDYVHFVENIRTLAAAGGHFDHHNDLAPEGDGHGHPPGAGAHAAPRTD